MEIKTTIFAFITAVVVFIVRQLSSYADENGDIYIKTPKELYKDIRIYFLNLKKNVTKIVEKRGKNIESEID